MNAQTFWLSRTQVSHTYSHSYTNTMLSTIYRGTFITFSVSQKPNKVQAQSHLELSYNQTKNPALTENYHTNQLNIGNM